MPVPWAQVWSGVAGRLAEHRAAGRGHLVTEDVVRFATVLELERVDRGMYRLRSGHI